MNDEILRNNKIAYTFFAIGILIIICTFLFDVSILLLPLALICFLVWFLKQSASRYCDSCSKFLRLTTQQTHIAGQIACSTCARKVRTGKFTWFCSACKQGFSSTDHCNKVENTKGEFLAEICDRCLPLVMKVEEK